VVEKNRSKKMVKMKKEEVEELLEKYPHLKKYVESIKHKMDDPIFYLTLPFETRDEEHPNLIYPAKGSVFVHIYKTGDMDERGYHAIEPELNEEEQKKHDQL